jgi:DNA adenine methylase
MQAFQEQSLSNVAEGTQARLVPFLKWAGGKRWLVFYYPEFLPKSFNTYIEPFLGAGSVYFYLQPEKAILGDFNQDLIATYRSIQVDWQSLQSSLRYRQTRHRADDKYYYWLRAKSPEPLVERASRLIYLNRTCFNGIYRVNRKGEFNVPRGTKDKVLLDTDNFEAMSTLLKKAELIAGDFERLVDRAEKNDFIFADPPYTVLHNYNGFLKYNEVLFSWADQERLAAALRRAVSRGAKVLCTNANHASLRELYSTPEFSLEVVSRASTISAANSSRKHFEELIIRSNNMKD